MSTLLYNPDKKDKQELIDEFVVRTETFDQIFTDLETGKMDHPEQHYLLLGQRGSGKTTLIMRLKYAVEDSPKLRDWLIPITFSEEQYNISELSDLWENIAAHLEDYHGFAGLTDKIEQYSEKEDFESIALDTLLKALAESGNKIVLFIDNIGDLLKKFDVQGVRRFREILQTKSQLRLIAGSAVVLESVLDYQQPLFEFFKVIQLKGLTNEESRTLLRKLAARHNETDKIETIIKHTPSRIETLRTLSGGVPRTMALLFRVFADSEHGNALSDLEKILDAVTPLYKHRMDDLPTQQQKIVDAVAKNWDAISVKELREKLRLDSKTISAQLGQLEKNMVVEKRLTNTKNHLYLLRERFFNIWYLMRYGRKQDRQRVIWLVRFLEMWCNKDELESRVLNYVKQVQSGTLPQRSIELYGQAYSFLNNINPEAKLELKLNTPHHISSDIIISMEEFSSLIHKYCKDANWDRFVRVAMSIPLYTKNHKDVVFGLLAEINDLTALDQTVVRILKERTSIEPTSPVPYFFMGYMLNGMIANVGKSIITGKQEEHESVVQVMELYNLAINNSEDDEFEFVILGKLLYTMLAFKRYNLVIWIFENSLATANLQLDKRFKILYHIAQILHNDGSSKLQLLDSELQKKVLEGVESITEVRKELESNFDIKL